MSRPPPTGHGRGRPADAKPKASLSAKKQKKQRKTGKKKVAGGRRRSGRPPVAVRPQSPPRRRYQDPGPAVIAERLAVARAAIRASGQGAPSTARAVIRAEYCREPVLRFAANREHVDPKTGLARFGPASLGTSRHPSTIRLGYIGSGASIDAARRWFERGESVIPGDHENHLPEFPGCADDRGFFTQLVHSDRLERRLTTHELATIKNVKRKIDRFQEAVGLVSEHMRLLTQQDEAPGLVILALPEELLDLTKHVTYVDPELGTVFRNFRRALKAELMRYGVPTQIVLPRVMTAQPGDPNVDHVSRVAWNLFTGMFYKGGGVPWKPVGLRPDTCYIGISFHHPLGTTDVRLRTSVAQAFDEYGIGLVLRGPDFPWNAERDGPSPHLNAEQATTLIGLVLARYAAETGRPPGRVVVHKTSRFWPAEREGFEAALSRVGQFDLVAVAPTSEVRLLRAGRYPPLRGTLFHVSELAYLYTTGYIPALQGYPHGHVPSPLQIADRYGDTALRALAEEILVLTKMNWNSAGFAGALPITVRFSRLVGNIMREIPADREPQPQFKFYT